MIQYSAIVIQYSAMMQDATVTQLLEQWNAGDPEAAVRIMPLVYDELRRIARGYFQRERHGHTLQATAVVHEAYVRLIEQSGIEWHDRAHFIGLAARVMRRVLVDYARERSAAKRGGEAQRVTLVEVEGLATGRSLDMIALDEALKSLAEVDELKVSIVELRFFGGLTIEETAAYLEVSPATVIRQWRRAKAWLYRQLSEGSAA